MNNRGISFNERFYSYSIWWGTFSSVFILVLVKFGIRNQAIFALKDLLVYFMAIGVISEIFNKKLIGFIFILMSALLILVMINYVFLNPTYTAAINNIRQILAPPVLLIVFCCVDLTEQSCKRMLKLLYRMIFIVFVFGFVEQVFQLWSKINLSEYFHMKSIPTDSHGLSYMFYEPMFNNRERMTSLFLDPISLGHFFASAGIFIYYLQDKTRIGKMAFYCCIAGLLFSLSKGAILQLGIGVFFFNRRILLPVRIMAGIIPLSVVLALDSAGIRHHIGSFLNAINTLRLFGYGIGNAGNYSIMFGGGSKISKELGISDTYIGSLLGQIGLINTLFWLIVCVIIIYIGGKGTQYVSTALNVFISMFSISILSENTMNVTTFLLPAIIIGLSSQLERYKTLQKYKDFSIQHQSMVA